MFLDLQILFSHIYIVGQIMVDIVFAVLIINSDGQQTFVIMIIFNLLSALEFAMLLFNVVYRCEKAYERRDDIISILDHVLVDKYINPLKKETLLDLRSLVYSRPIQFTAANFYRLEYSLLVAFCSVLTTYTIILMQNLK
ncbi:hypothetical protein ABMA28_006020 [Loxostege sticticalis]|uniref:Gustatory receptor n=1 Tax=Loxostege sticticalis TaxID=481309 RepID=A0ABD0SJR3_LOXSC